MQDPVDHILKQWGDVKPELDCSDMGIVGRLMRVHGLWHSQLEHVFKQHQLSMLEFDILATLMRNQQPLTPTEMYKTLMISSGAMSTRIEKLVQRGLVERLASGDDRRSCKVTLTKQGAQLVDEALASHLSNMNGMLSMFDEQEKAQLANMMRKVLLANQ
ncbi:MarR family transcriptional regulator [Vibrio coralliilyticus]|uniref:MarR family winged helix-turn-helix transcriptional regulator n=1 Tax=Vibrio coralliilyticus TaxID=190893 RepID=UPI000BAAA314|nr:MarR family transcriptional regulator [Vibrio coralliilyticus]PAU39844.1 MarR family transcriptional regulator [Vibrio coralliilyticus]